MLKEYACILTPEEVSEILRIGMNRTYTLLNQNQIKAFREGRIWKIPKISVIEYITQRRNSTSGSP